MEKHHSAKVILNAGLYDFRFCKCLYDVFPDPSLCRRIQICPILSFKYFQIWINYRHLIRNKFLDIVDTFEDSILIGCDKSGHIS